MFLGNWRSSEEVAQVNCVVIRKNYFLCDSPRFESVRKGKKIKMKVFMVKKERELSFSY